MLKLPPDVNGQVWERVLAAVSDYDTGVDTRPLNPQSSDRQIKNGLDRFTFEQALDPLSVVDYVAAELRDNQLQTSHVQYYGLFNPASTSMGIVADALTAAYNPQLASSSHSPFATAVERHLVQAIGARFGYQPGSIDGTFTSGGAEANHTSLVCALTHKFPDFKQLGLRALPAQPVFYVTAESHHSLLKAAALTGLGMNACREVPVGKDLKMDVSALSAMIESDISSGMAPFMIVATAGTTNAGMIDPIKNIHEIAMKHHLWLHVDAAYGGAALLLPELKSEFAGIEESDSITFDCHKWLSVPMGAGMYLTRHTDVLENTFRVAAGYMPKETDDAAPINPFAHSMQWSRRFIGLKVFMSLATAGWDGYTQAIRHQAKMGALLRDLLARHNWQICNETRLPVVCFTGTTAAERELPFLEAIADQLLQSGSAWISTTRLSGNSPSSSNPSGGTPVLRACVTNYRTGASDIEQLVSFLDSARTSSCKKALSKLPT